MSVIALTNVRPYGESTVNVLIKDGQIASVGEDVDTSKADEVLDGQGWVLLPGLVDME